MIHKRVLYEGTFWPFGAWYAYCATWPRDESASVLTGRCYSVAVREGIVFA